MNRKIIKINEEKCNGCGACATACYEGAIGMENAVHAHYRQVENLFRGKL